MGLRRGLNLWGIVGGQVESGVELLLIVGHIMAELPAKVVVGPIPVPTS